MRFQQLLIFLFHESFAEVLFELKQCINVVNSMPMLFGHFPNVDLLKLIAIVNAQVRLLLLEFFVASCIIEKLVPQIESFFDFVVLILSSDVLRDLTILL